MNKVITAIVLAAATYAVQRFLAQSGAAARPRKHHVDTWENEGGALAPQHVPVETSQVPR
jgi:hypothetical protein